MFLDAGRLFGIHDDRPHPVGVPGAGEQSKEEEKRSELRHGRFTSAPKRQSSQPAQQSTSAVAEIRQRLSSFATVPGV